MGGHPGGAKWEDTREWAKCCSAAQHLSCLCLDVFRDHSRSSVFVSKQNQFPRGGRG